MLKGACLDVQGNELYATTNRFEALTCLTMHFLKKKKNLSTKGQPCGFDLNYSPAKLESK